MVVSNKVFDCKHVREEVSDNTKHLQGIKQKSENVLIERINFKL